MIKFVLAVVAVVFVGLAYYAYTDKPNNIDVKTAVTEKEPMKTEKVSVVAQDLKEKKSSAKVKKVIELTSVTNELTEQEETIDEGITHESIEDDHMSEEERRIDKAIRSQSGNIKFEVSNEEEILETIEKDYGKSD